MYTSVCFLFHPNFNLKIDFLYAFSKNKHKMYEMCIMRPPTNILQRDQKRHFVNVNVYFSFSFCLYFYLFVCLFEFCWCACDMQSDQYQDTNYALQFDKRINDTHTHKNLISNRFIYTHKKRPRNKRNKRQNQTQF